MNKILKIIGGIFSAIGLLFLIVGIYFYIDTENFKKSAIKTNGKIVEIINSYDSDGDSSHDVYVEFYVKETLHKGKINYYNSNMYEGKDIIIYYNPDNPNNFKGEGLIIGTLIFGILGGVFFIIGIAFLISVMIKNKKNKRVVGYNYKINAAIIGIVMDNYTRINGRHPYILEANCMSPVDGKMYYFKSEHIWQDATLILQQYNITTIPVFVNPQNYAEYVVDISSIKKHIGN